MMDLLPAGLPTPEDVLPALEPDEFEFHPANCRRARCTENACSTVKADSTEAISDTRAKELKFHAVNIARRVRNPLISFSAPLFWEQGAAGSNPAAPANKIKALADLCVPQECRCGTVANLIG